MIKQPCCWLNGKTIDKILIPYDHTADTGDFKAYIDDIAIGNQILITITVMDSNGN